MTEMTVIERVAREICLALAPGMGAMPTQFYADRNWRKYSQAAIRAIEAMRDPTQEMIAAGLDALAFKAAPTSIDVWGPMIDAAREEPK